MFCASDWAGTKDVEGHPPFLGANLDQPNPAYWQRYEQMVQYANEQGLVVLVVGLMEPVKRYPDPASAQAFARHRVARLMGNFVLFSPSFDSRYLELGDVVGQTIRESSSLHLSIDGQNVQVLARAMRVYASHRITLAGGERHVVYRTGMEFVGLKKETAELIVRYVEALRQDPGA